eukprot:CAMPEP_0197012170 /NCGR_PEP_ID=MMETSP1380-20130617/61519_1 /TAXON_ID=5936 /ORGANISM="Euplotes crassus, Strain CT5" /LENGTH=253 /DNA_ID=CAMNT_0042435461 /DNA_START=42 /DNA_END=800 /DNA_ORIENTATION=-
MSKHPKSLNPSEEDIKMLLACQSHIGNKNSNIGMEPYLYKRRADGIHILNLQKTWEKIVFAARVIVAIENPEDIVVVSGRPYGQRAALKFAAYTGARAFAGRFTPGTFTNYITRAFKEPRLLIVTDPINDHQAVTEAAYVNIPTIAICDSDSSLKYVDIAIPANNKGKLSLGLIYWLLAREVLRMRGTISRSSPWNVMVDMFLYRDPEQTDKDEASRENRIEDVPADEPVLPGESAVDNSTPINWDQGTAAGE